MDESLLVVVLVNLLLVLLIALVALMLVAWRKRKQSQAELEHLLDDIKDRQGQRSDQMAEMLVGKYRLDEQKARELSESLILAEKQFLHGFFEQQMQQQAVSGFYDGLCRLLNSYLSSMPGSETAEVAGEELPDDNSGQETEPSDEKEKSAAGNPPPDWGDVFD
ncbi:hypothetical protein [Methylococcaceae bacterium WWC4]|uniref:hypothetical protein n=1 Tax=Methylomonas sp. CM2 TaxID=3417647 RepID=UPI00143933DE|nr:hypothetical protein [Methylococcaceae bacterium WWC4]